MQSSSPSRTQSSAGSSSVYEPDAGASTSAAGPWSAVPSASEVNDAEKKTYIKHEPVRKVKWHRTMSSIKGPEMSEVDAKIAAAEARTDSKFAEMMGELRVISTRMDHIEKSTSGLRLNTWLASATTVALVVAIFAWGAQMFGGGMDAATIANRAVAQVEQKYEQRLQEQEERSARIDAQLALILQRMNTEQ